MAYMNQESKAKIATALKAVMPKGWKYTLSVRHHSTIVMTISEAPVDILGEMDACAKQNAERMHRDHYPLKGHADINKYHFATSFTKGSEAERVIRLALRALHSADYFDDSDAQTDYFHTAYYVDLNIGKWDRPFKCTGAAFAQTGYLDIPLYSSHFSEESGEVETPADIAARVAAERVETVAAAVEAEEVEAAAAVARHVPAEVEAVAASNVVSMAAYRARRVLHI